MAYGADFATADAANAPLDAPLMIGADPVLWGALLLGLIAAALVGWYFGDRSRAGKNDAPRAIWKAIDDAAKSAMQADDNALKGRAEHLSKVIRSRLGRTLAFNKGLAGRTTALQDAVDGKGPPDGHDHGHGNGAPGDSHGGHQTPGDHPPALPAVTITVGPPPAHGPGGHPPAAGAHEPPKRDLTQREQTNALRLAVAAFNQHWRDETERVNEMRAVHAELSSPGPRPSPKTEAARRISGTRAGH